MEQQADSKHNPIWNYTCDGLLLFLLTLAVYFPTIHNGFVDFDDPRTILNNPVVTHFSWQHLISIWTNINAKPFAPPVFSIYSAVYAIWGPNATAFHGANVILHGINAALVYLMVSKLFKNRMAALIAGLLFALHPLHVDAVCWASALKDVLSGTFVFASVLVYLRYMQTHRASLLVIAVIFYCLALLSKPISALLPYLLLIVDYQQRRKDDTYSLREKAPFFVAALVIGIITLHAQTVATTDIISSDLSFYDRTNAWASIGFYIWKLVLPLKLSILYATQHTTGWYWIMIGLSLAFVSTTVWMLMLSRDYGFGLAWFVLLSTPILGFVPFGYVVRVAPFANHYMYVADVGLFVVAALIVKDIHKRLATRPARSALFAMLFIAFGLYATKTTLRCKIWHNTETLWRDSVRYNDSPNASIGYFRLAKAYFNKGDLDTARMNAEEAVRLRPDNLGARDLIDEIQSKSRPLR